jgi:pimeloyl-ACP methyl ester carboxylesterase
MREVAVNHRLTIAVALFLLILVACGPTGAPGAEESAPSGETKDTGEPEAVEPAVEALPEQEEVAQADAESEPQAAPAEPGTIEDGVTVEASDGLALVGTFYPGGDEPPWPGVILLHMLGSDRGVWEEFATSLNESGYAVFALDMRGHGSTGGAQDWGLAPDDLQRVWAYMAGRDDVDEARTAVVGGSIGANMALITGAGEPSVDTVVLLSPGLDYRGVTTEDAMAAFGERPALIVASGEDGYAADSSRTLHELAVGESELVIYEGAGHGTNMFGPEPELGTLIIEWLDSTVG